MVYCKKLAKHFYTIKLWFIILFILFSSAIFAYPLSSFKSDDPEQHNFEEYELEEFFHGNIEREVITPSGLYDIKMPKNAPNIKFILQKIYIDGLTAFPISKIEKIYLPYINKQISLETVYNIAKIITKYYRDAGYFLSIAYVPPQSIKNGKIYLKIIEGYIAKIELADELKNHFIVKQYVNLIKSKKPIAIQDIENFLLSLNAFPQYSVTSILSKLEGSNNGASKLILQVKPKKSKQQVSFDNMSSKILGPGEFSWLYNKSLFYPQEVTMYGLFSCPQISKIKHLTVQNLLYVAPNFSWEIIGSATKTHPGSNLKTLEMSGDTKFIGTNLIYNLLNQRKQRVTIKFTFNYRNSSNYVQKKLSIDDKLRMLKVGISYYKISPESHYNAINLIISRGINGLGASQRGSILLSRINAEPNFNKVELAISRLQKITKNWVILLSSSMQYSADSLLSSELFGYGGQAFGKAFDSYEITGDHGIAGLVELSYNSLNIKQTNIIPFLYYDIGFVQNKAKPNVLVARKHGSSIGFGLRGNIDFGLSGSIGLAWPLVKGLATRQDGKENIGTRFLFQISLAY